MKGLIKLCSGGSTMWRGWRVIDRSAKRVYVGEWAGSHSVGRPQKRWIDIVKECLRKRGLDVRQARRMVGVCWGNAWVVAWGVNDWS